MRLWAQCPSKARGPFTDVGCRQINDLRLHNEILERRARLLEDALAAASPGVANTDPTATGSMHLGQLMGGIASNISHPSPSGAQDAAIVSASSQMLREISLRSRTPLSIPLLNIYPNLPETLPAGTITNNSEEATGLSALSEWMSMSDIPNGPSLDTAIESCKAFLSGHKQSNHIVDEETIMRDVHAVFEDGALNDPSLAGSRFRCFMILYLAQERYWKGGVVEDQGNSSLRALYRQFALRDVCATMGKEDIVSKPFFIH